MKVLTLLLIPAALLAGCASPVPLPPARVVMFGEAHDQPDQQAQVAATVAELADRGELAAVVIEMAERGRDTTTLARQATPAQARHVLAWASWPWDRYAAVVMNAVRAGVPVFGGNLPRAEMKATMADASLERHLDDPARQKVTRAVSEGHCGMLPAGQEAPMVRVQIARDRAMAATVAEQAARAAPGRRVLLLAGAQHVSRDRGVPLHLDPSLSTHVVMFGPPDGQDLVADTWQPARERHRPDPCEELRRRGLTLHQAG